MKYAPVIILLLAACALGSDRITLAPETIGKWEPISQDTRPSILADKVNIAPTIDGKLDDSAWKTAATLGPFASQLNLPEGANRWVNARFCWTDRALIIGATLAYPGDALRAKITSNSGRVWSDDALELFLYTPGTQKRHHLVINARAAHVAFVDVEGEKWSPAVDVAATINQRNWCVEAAIPFADIGISNPLKDTLQLQVRYLVNDQSAWSMWTTSMDTSAFGKVAFDPSQNVEQLAQPKAIYFPTVLPAGTQRVMVEAHNPTDKIRRVMARLIDQDAQQTLANQYVDLPAGQTQRINLDFEVPRKGVIERMLLFKDLQGGGNLIADRRRISALPDLQVSLWRQRIWYGDPRLEGTLTIGAPDAANLKIELWADTHRVAQLERAVLDQRVFTLRVATDDLKPGSYRLITSCDSADGPIRKQLEIELKQNAPMPTKKRIALNVDWPEGAAVDTPQPLYVGVSFPGGMLMDSTHVRLVSDDGQSVPMQSRILARWSPNGSIRWLGIDFLGTHDQAYFVEVGSDVQAHTPATVMKVNEDADTIYIDTRVTRFELPKRGALVGKAWRGDMQVLAGDTPCLLVTDQNGRTANEAHGRDDTMATIESSGPVQVVVRREGTLRTATDEELARYVVRLYFTVGVDHVRIEHSLIQTQDSNKLQFSDIALRFKPAAVGPWRVALDDAPKPDNTPFEQTIDVARGEGLYLAQLVHPHHHQTDSKFTIGKRQGGEWTAIQSGEACGQWASARGADGAGIAVTIRDFARTFPKELEVTSDGVTAHLWSSRGGRTLDHRTPALIEHWGKDWVEAHYPGGVKAMGNLHSDAAGTARTHDVTLQLLSPSSHRETVAQVAQLADQPALVIQDPHWLRETEAMGRIHPYDPARFPVAEKFLEQYFDEMIEGQATRWGDYGYLDYGSGPHTYERRSTIPGAPNGQPRLNYRYYASDYNYRTVLWMNYARSGDRRYFTYGDAFNRHLADFKIAHTDAGRFKPKGVMLGGGPSEENPIYWGGSMGHYPTGAMGGHQGVDLDNFLYEYFLTGDRHVHEAVTLFAERLAEHFDPLVLPNIGASSTNHLPYGFLAILYQQTWDERFARLLEQTRPRTIDPTTTNGQMDMDYFGSWYKWYVRLWSTLRDWQCTGNGTAKEVLIKAASNYLHYKPDGTTGYQDHTGRYASEAYALTGDKRYANWIAARLNRIIAENTTTDGGIEPVAYAGSWSATFAESFAYGLDAVADAGDDVEPWPLIDLGINANDVSIVFKKPRGSSLLLDLRHEADWDIRVTNPVGGFRRPERGHYSGPILIEDHPKYFERDLPGLTGGYARVHLPTEAVDGEYQLINVPMVMSSNADKLAMVARQGMYLDAMSAKPPVWYFAIPPGKAGGLFANRDVVIHIGEQTYEVAAGTWCDFEAIDTPRIASIHAHGLVFVRFRGQIPAVLTAHDPEKLFVPAGEVLPIEIAAPQAITDGFAAGFSEAETDRALAMHTNQSLRIPRGEAVADRAFEHFDYRHGTIEFYLRPRWTATMQPQSQDKYLLSGAAFPLFYSVRVADHFNARELSRAFNLFQTHIPAESGYPSIQRHYLPVTLTQGKWYHVAFCWDTHPTRGWLSEMYVDGKPSNPDNRINVGLSRWGESERNHIPLVVKIPPSGVILVQGTIDGDIDELRISDVPRYPMPFEARKPVPFEPDDHTLLLMHFDGDTQAITPKQGKTIAVEVQ